MRLISATAAALLVATLAQAAPVEPSVTAGRVLTPSVDVTKAPAYPVVELTINNGTVGVGSLMVSLQSPSGLRYLNSGFVYPPAYPPAKIQHLKIAVASPFTGQGFGLYTEPGAWTVAFIVLFTNDEMSVPYSGSQLAALFSNQNTVQVANPASPDITPPTINNATILTPTVSLSSTSPVAAIRVPAIDGISGVVNASVQLTQPGNATSLNLFTALDAPASHADVVVYQSLPSATVKGTYTIANATVCDYAGNCNTLNTPAQIAAHFSATTIKVTR